MRSSARLALEIRVDGATRSLGRALGEALARAVPDRRLRVAVLLVLAAAGGAALFYVFRHTGRFGAQLAIMMVLSLVLGALRRFLRRQGVVD
jgi:hypothetical protein